MELQRAAIAVQGGGAERGGHIATIMPIRTAEGVIIGGVLSCDEVHRIETASADIRREQRRLRHPAVHSFSELSFKSEKTERFLDLASRYAKSDSPVLIQVETGCYPQILAECIHNASERREMPFVQVNCAELRPEEQLHLLFGSTPAETYLAHSMCALAHMGTLYLQNPECLCSQAQNRLGRLLTEKILLNPENASPYPLDVRVITSSQKTPASWTNAVEFDPGLQLLLSGLSLNVPPLRDCPDELQRTYETYLQQYLKKYQRYLSITEGGKAWFLAQDWPGNYLQLERFCERLVLSAPRRSIDERLLTTLYRETAPVSRGDSQSSEPTVQYIAPEAAKITEVLTKHLGNRGAAAKELGISTSTLWRKVKKYNINLP